MRMKEIDQKRVEQAQGMPAHYPLCNRSDCPLVQQCLRGIHYPQHAMDTYLTLVNPNVQHALGTDCPYYRDSTPVRYAQGFEASYKAIYPEHVRTEFRSRCMHALGASRSLFYYQMAGNRLLTPIQQQKIQDVARQMNLSRITFPNTFLAPQW